MSTSLPDDFDADKAARLAKTRRWAQGVLIALVCVYLATHLPDDPPMWVRLIRHMAEAGMIGGMADWFAVEALFRHPFGLKIPHTALLPRNQKRAAESVGQFFNSYFLDPASISARVAEMAPARRAAEWLVNADNAALVAKPLTQALTVAMQPKDGVTLPKGLRQEIRSAVGSDEFTSALVTAMGPMLEKGLDGPFLNDTLKQVSAALDGNRGKVLEIVQDNSRWWAPTQVDKGVSNLLVDGVLGVIEDLQDPKSDLRRDFEGGLTGFLAAVSENGALQRAVHEGKAGFVASEAFDATLEDMLALLRTRLADGMADGPEAGEAIAVALHRFADKLLSEPETLARFEAQLTTTAETAVVELREPISGYVTDVIGGWDAQTLSQRFEQEVGPDLQFIRINGAVLGTLIGGVLFFVGRALEAL
ncbi:MAG: DUF445 domain-containing protein [Rhodobacteraceae bacterium]|nr:DUF445 domain-containing protein [Paracoccaceae bacterium]